MSEKTRTRSPQDYLRPLLRHKMLFGIAAAATAAILLYVAENTTQLKYTASARFSRQIDWTADMDRTHANEALSVYRNRVTLDLAGHDAVDEVARGLDLFKGQRFPQLPDGRLTEEGERTKEQRIAEFREAITVRYDIQSANLDVITISFTHEDPKLAMEIPNRLAERYMNRTKQAVLDDMYKKRDFLKEKVAENKRLLEDRQRDRAEFDKKHPGMTPESVSGIQTRIDNYSMEMDNIRRQTLHAQRKLAVLRAQLAEIGDPCTDGAQPEVRFMVPNPRRMDLLERQRQAIELLRNLTSIRGMKEMHPEVIKARKEMEYLGEQLQQEPNEVAAGSVYRNDSNLDMRRLMLNTDIADAKIQLETLAARDEQLAIQKRNSQKLLDNFSSVRQQYLGITDGLRKQEEEMSAWEGRLEEAEMLLLVEVDRGRTSLKALERAQEPYRPSSPKLAVVLGGPIFGGLAIAGLIVFLLHLVDRTIASTEDALEHFGVPVHGAIREFGPRSRKWMLGLRNWLLLPVVALLLAVAVGNFAARNVLRLESPVTYQRWKESPVRYVTGKVQGLIQQVRESL